MKCHRRRGRPLLAAALTMVAACSVEVFPSADAGVTATDGAEGVAGRDHLDLSEGAAVQYWGTFDWDGAVLVDGRYVFENDLGFRFRIETFALATATIQIRPCAAEAETETASWLRWGFPRALADHVVDDDASLAIVDKAEDAFDTSLNRLATGIATGGRYCDAFLLSAVLTESAPPLGEHTLALVGAYQHRSEDADNEDDWVTFDAVVPLADGMLEAFGTEGDVALRPSEVDDDAEVDIVVTRHPVQAFQSLDPRVWVPVELAWEVLGNVLHGSSVRFHYR